MKLAQSVFEIEILFVNVSKNIEQFQVVNWDIEITRRNFSGTKKKLKDYQREIAKVVQILRGVYIL